MRNRNHKRDNERVKQRALQANLAQNELEIWGEHLERTLPEFFPAEPQFSIMDLIADYADDLQLYEQNEHFEWWLENRDPGTFDDRTAYGCLSNLGYPVYELRSMSLQEAKECLALELKSLQYD